MTILKYVFLTTFTLTLTLTTKSFAAFIPQKIVTGIDHTCVLSTAGQIKCWGYNGFRQLGTNDDVDHGKDPETMGPNLTIVNLGEAAGDPLGATDICAGLRATCAITTKGTVKCWGYNNGHYGALGQGNSSDTSYRTGNELPFTDLGTDFQATQITCGDYRACALSNFGQVKCWGYNFDGALGLGDQEHRGDSPENMGNHLPAISELAEIKTISSGASHTCALTSNEVRCWGSSFLGQSGLESRLKFGHSSATIPAKLPAVKLTSANEKILSLQVGSYHSCVLLTSANDPAKTSLKCWGDNRDGILGAGDSIAHGADPNTMGDKLPFVNLGVDDIVSIHPHYSFTCVLTKKGQVKCWGKNEFGQLGLEDSENRGSNPSELGVNLPFVDLGLPVKSLSIGSTSRHSCAILINSEIKCWGLGTSGQLGYESSENIGRLRGHMGEKLPFVRIH